MKLLVMNLATDADDPILGFTTSWLTALAARVEAVDVITMRVGRLDLPENVRVGSLGKERGLGDARRGARFFSLLARSLGRDPVDACFAHMTPRFAEMAAPFLRSRRVPLTLWYAQAAASATLRRAAWWADTVVTTSESSFPFLIDHLVVTGQGIETDRFRPGLAAPATRPFTVLTAGRIAPVKRLELFVDASGQRDDDGTRYRVVGPTAPRDRGYAEALRRRLVSIGRTGAVSIEGPQSPSELVETYREADVFVNLSDSAAMDKAALEAMACAVPVVTSNVSFGPLLRPVEPRLLVPSDSGAVARAIDDVRAMTPDHRRGVGERLRAEVVSQHGLNRLADLLVDDVFRRSPRSLRRRLEGASRDGR